MKLILLKDENFIRELEGRILLFTSSVIVLACCSFAFGGNCSAWQWYVPLFLSSIWGGTLHRNTSLAFVALIVILWLAAPLCLNDYSYNDNPSCHLPMIRLLSFGWNPFSDPEAQGICSQLGLDIWGMRPYHVAYCTKPAAIFNAVAYSFIKAPYAITYPLPFLLFASVFMTSLRVFRRDSVVMPVIMMGLLWYRLQWGLFVDSSLMLASAGLILTMYADLRDERLTIVPLAGYGFWMLNLKLPGVFAYIVFFLAFSFVKLWRHRSRRMFLTLIILALILAVGSSLLSFSPYGTSLRDKGHPFYPVMTSDEAKFPTHDLVWDFKENNEDAKQMGHVGSFVNAYVSPLLARAYYNWKFNRTDFSPHKFTWDFKWHDSPNAATSPLQFKGRVAVLFTVLLMLIFSATRALGVGIVILMVAFPLEQIGFLRYQPWIIASWCIVSTLALDFILRRFCTLERIVKFCLVALIAIVAGRSTHRQLRAFCQVASEIKSMPHEIFTCCPIPRNYPPSWVARWAEFEDFKKEYSTDLILLNRQLSIDQNHKVISTDENEIWKSNMHLTSLGYFARRDTRVCDDVSLTRLLGESCSQRARRLMHLKIAEDE